MSSGETLVGHHHGDSATQLDAMMRMISELRRERDEARREVCELHADRGLVFRRVNKKNVPVDDPKFIAQMKNWDCYNAHNDDGIHRQANFEGS